MKRFMTVFFVLAFMVSIFAQDVSKGISPLVLQDGTPVQLRLSRTVSSADSQLGDTIDFEVLEEVDIGNTVVIPKGGIAWATVTAAQPKRRMGRGGKLDMVLDSVRLYNGEKAALSAVKNAKGGGHTGAMTGAIVASAIVLWPAAPLFLLMHGKDITVPKGTKITAYISGDFKLKTEVAPTSAPQAQGISVPPTAIALAPVVDVTTSPEQSGNLSISLADYVLLQKTKKEAAEKAAAETGKAK
jgi:hypothetical protein